MKKTPVTFVLALAVTVAPDVSAAEPAAVDALFVRFTKPDSPGANLVVIRDGRIVYEHSYALVMILIEKPIWITNSICP